MADLFRFYILGLALAAVFGLASSIIWLLFRVVRRKDRLAVQRRSFLYDLLMINLVTIPVASFAFAALVIMLQA
ncbi:DUF4059 family protein [Streptococcus sp. DD12]|uniref:DUF4059 family protein n=1 Tax=Streptococcus sp. DD12 TaxID=1777880 RepID=UPI0007984318|nr:DUF4059 family protein [Streptococcus sp. DD12]KXT75810.1 hypothetical protein STRDD12_00922 [Streptococcus sp. DD12]